MTAVCIFLRAELRRRWRAWLCVALIAGVFAGMVTAAAAGARRTDSSYPRLLAWSQPPDLLLVSGYSAALAPLPRAALTRLPHVAVVAYVQQIALAPGAGITLLAPEDDRIPGSFWKRKILAGRLADPGRPDEVNVSFMMAQAQHLRPGDSLRVLLRTTRGTTVPVSLRVAGIEAAAPEFPPQVDSGPGDVWATPAFWHAHRAASQAFPMAALRLRHGSADLTVVRQEITRLARGKVAGIVPLAGQSANTQRSIHMQAVAVWLLAGTLAVIGVLVLGQLLSRQNLADSTEYRTLRAVGLSRRQLMAIGAGRATAIGTAGACVAVVLASALSPLLPVGLAGVAEPHPGLDVDGLAFAIGGLATALVTVACAAPSAWRTAARDHATDAVPAAGGHSRPVIPLAGGRRAVPRMIGVRFALQAGAGPTALPIRSTIAGTVIGVAALCAALVFSASLSHLFATPRLYGVTWHAIVSSTTDAELTPAVRMVAHDPAVAAWSAGYSNGELQINGIRVDAIAMSNGRGPSLMATPVQGRLPQRQDEITLGAQTLASTHTRIGGIAQVSMPGQHPVPFRIVGAAVYPALSDALGLGQGAALTVGGVHRLLPSGMRAPPFDALLVRFRSDISAQDGRDALASRVARAGPFIVQEPPTPAALVNFGRVRNLPMLLGIALGSLALITITHLLITSVRRRRRDFAILRALGLTRGQIRRASAWQASTLTGAALALGIPSGVVCGSIAWRIFADHLGILPVPEIPVQQLAVVVSLALALTGAIAALPGESTARAKPAQVLRSE
jgi:putative ABC transport system permease protein